MLPDFEISCDAFKKYNIELTEELYRKLDIYADFLVEYNKNVNLTALTDPHDILFKHFIDSIILTLHVELKKNSSIIDVGTGAGFPSVPIKLFRPDMKITLLDSLNKRIVFLEKLCDKLEIDAEFVHGRAEDISKNANYREKFDISCARAVANMSLLSELCIPFVKVGGIFTALKGPAEDITQGHNAIKILGGSVEAVKEYSIEDEGRKVVIVRKISQTPTKYPRNSSQIKKKNL